jgi:Ca2+-dependent lipid-binding protein
MYENQEIFIRVINGKYWGNSIFNTIDPYIVIKFDKIINRTDAYKNISEAYFNESLFKFYVTELIYRVSV